MPAVLAELFEHRSELPGPADRLDAKALPGGRGVCALVDGSDRLIQTLSSENLRRTLHHRLEPPNEPQRRPRANLRDVARFVCWTSTHSAFETALTYLRIARRLQPQRYRRDLAFGPAWFARVDPQARWPRWVADKLALTPPTVDVGPFRDRPSCRRFIELLEDLFDLCRYHDILQQAPQGQACAYKEMGKCPAPCDGTVSMEVYRAAISASIDFALGASADRMSQLESDMTAAADGLQFERAARIREQISRARKTLADDGRLQPYPAKFRYLVIQRGGGTTHLKPFFVDRGAIAEGETVTLKEVEATVGQWADNMRAFSAETAEATSQECSEGIWLVSHFINRGERTPGLFVHQSQLGTPDELARRVVRKLGKTPQRGH